MQEISLNILDIVQNSIKANATLIKIEIDENIVKNELNIFISDNGCGMTKEQLAVVTNPFFTTRTTRKIGLGVPLFKMAAEMTGGSFEIKSKIGIGTQIVAKFVYDNIDRMPLGDMTETIAQLVQCNANIDFIYTHKFNKKEFVMNTKEFRQILGDIPLDNIEVIMFIKNFLNENFSEIRKV